MSDFVLRAYLRLSAKLDMGEARPADLSLLDAITAELRRNKSAWVQALEAAA